MQIKAYQKDFLKTCCEGLRTQAGGSGRADVVGLGFVVVVDGVAVKSQNTFFLSFSSIFFSE